MTIDLIESDVDRFVRREKTPNVFCVANDGEGRVVVEDPDEVRDGYDFLVYVNNPYTYGFESWIVKWEVPGTDLVNKKLLSSRDVAVKTVVDLLSDFVE